MKLNLKYNAANVDEIEQAQKQSIEACITNTSIGSICLFIQKGLVNESGHVGVSKTVALDTIDKYLEENDKNELILDIMEALVNAGFLAKDLDVEQMREVTKKRQKQLNNRISESL